MVRRSLLLVLALAAVASIVIVPAAGASKSCSVTSTGSGQSYGTLEEAVSAATAGDTLQVKGTCYGTTTIAKNLTIVGQNGSGSGQATLDGAKSGSVVTVERGVTVAITRLTITGGSGSTGRGITNFGSLTLTDSTVTGNTAGGGYGGGIFNGGDHSPEASLTITDSTVADNTVTTASFGHGGGIEVTVGSLTLTNSTVRGNAAPRGGGGIFGSTTILSGGGRNSLTLDNSAVTRNTATGSFEYEGKKYIGHGGGIQDFAGTVTLNGSSSVSRNEAAGDGGGIYSGKTLERQADSVILNDSSSVTRNTAGGDGGGIYSEKSGGATLTFGMGWMGSVSGNEPDDIFFE